MSQQQENKNDSTPLVFDNNQQEPVEEEKWHAKPIDKEQINASLGLLKELYPIGETPLIVAYPALGYICCCLGSYSPGKVYMNETKEDDEQPLNPSRGTTLLNGKQQKVKTMDKPKNKAKVSNEEAIKDPFVKLGTGMVAYRDLLYVMIWTFFLFSVMSIPALYAFRSYHAYDQIPLALAGYEKLSLGNMGYSTTQCGVAKIQVGALAMTCPYGYVGELLSIGVNPSDATQTSCVTSEAKQNEQCKVDEVVSPLALQVEASNLDGTDTSQYFEVTPETIYGPDYASKPSECTDSKANFFIQFACVQNNDDMVNKYHILCVVSVIGLFMCLIFMMIIRCLRKQAIIQRLEWDLSTVTAADYTVEMDVKPKAYHAWLDNVYNVSGGPKDRGIAPVTAFKDDMILEIETKLSDAMESRRTDNLAFSRKSTRSRLVDVASDESKIQVADVIFAYDNSKMIHLLRARGNDILHLKFDKMREKDKQIDELINTEFIKLTEPVSAFIIFEEEDGILIALEESEKNKKATVLGMPMKFTQASQPTNIIWENRHFTNCERTIRGIIVTIITIILLGLSFWAIVLTQAKALSVDSTFPPTTDCDQIVSSYGDNLETFAGYEWEQYEYNHKSYLPGALQCFCQKEISDIGYSEAYDTKYPVTYSNGTTTDEEICETYLDVVSLAYVLSTSLTYVITTINYVLRVIVIAMIMRVGFATETGLLSWITTGVFLTQFFNTAFLLLLVNATLSGQPASNGLVGGQISDFDMVWFNSIGNDLIGTIIFIAYWPLLEFFMYYGIRLLFRCFDRGCNSCDKYKTKKTSLWQYTNLYAGPEYYMHYKYSAVLNVTFCTFMYGFGLPLLFPIAFMSFVILYFAEKSMLYWSYRLPPMYDEKLNDSVLSKLQWAPMFFLIIGYWMMSSNQLIGNQLIAKDDAKASTVTGHTSYEMFHSDGWILPAWPYLLFFWLWLVYLTVGTWIWKVLVHYFPSLEIGDVDINEDIDNYYKALDDQDRLWTIKEEENCRNVIGMRCQPEAAFKRFQCAISSDATIMGVHTYDILANPLYNDAFQYFSAALDHREMYIVDDDDDESNDNAQSDMVRAALNLGFMTKEKALEFKFNKELFIERRASSFTKRDSSKLNDTRDSIKSAEGFEGPAEQEQRKLLLLPEVTQQ